MRRSRSHTKTKMMICSLILILVLSPLAHVGAQEQKAAEDDRDINLERYFEIYHYLKEYHVSATSSELLTEWAIYGLLYALEDPYTYFMDDDEFEQLLAGINGEMTGVGIILTYNEDGIMIEDILPGSSALRAGLQPGDILTHVNGEDLQDVLFLEEVSMRIVDSGHSGVSLTILREDNLQMEEKTFHMQLEKITVPAVQSFMLDDKVGYLKLTSFGEKAGEAVQEELKRLQSQGMEKLVFDLRGNPGGFINAAADVAKQFKEDGVLTYLKDSKGELTAYEIEGGQPFDLPLAVLIDEGSASASEVLAGFLQDEEIGYVLGDLSFGKGTIQELVPLETGGVLRISVEEYFTPAMKQVNTFGIEPDLVVHNRKFQLAKAYGYLTEKEEMHVHQDGELLLNGIHSPTVQKATYLENGKIYLSIRTLAEWYNGEADWDAVKKAVVLNLFDQDYSIARGHQALKFIQGTSFIDVTQIDSILPLTVEKVGQTFVISKQ